ncbi:MAG: hypothetical protein HY902_13330, partial [Deltaproteobacteria bacterium]|nr:hypothetical protein [Deltaproteobacteria bacterium]
MKNSAFSSLSAVVFAALCQLSGLGLLAAPVYAAVPATTAIEGAMSSVGGGPVSDGIYPLTFSLLDG